MYEFEKLLQIADRELGNDGRIALPYWNWMELEHEGQILPAILREHFNSFPDGYLDQAKFSMPLMFRRVDEQRYATVIRRWKVREDAYECLLNVNIHYIYLHV